MFEPDSDFLDWCIDNSFEVDELSSSTKKKLNILKSNPMPEWHIQIYHFKKIVETCNLTGYSRSKPFYE